MRYNLSFFLSSLSILAVNAMSAGPNTYGVPPYLWQYTNTIETYNPALGYTRSHAHGSVFTTSLQTLLHSKYPSISTSSASNKDSWVTQANVTNDANTQSYEMPFYSGHGWNDGSGFVTYEHGTLSANSRTFGTWNRWVFMDLCEFLRDHDASHYSHMFNGLHAVFGYESEMWYFIIPYSCGLFSTCHYRSEDMWGNFADRWVNSGYNMWDSFRYANLNVVYQEGRQGVAPAVVYNWHDGWNGYTFIGNTEYVTNVFNGDVPVQSLFHQYVVYGTPSY